MPTAFAERLHDTRLSLGRRIVEHIRNGTSDLADAAMRNDVSVYTDPARHAAERQKLFRETPVVACLSNDIKEPGQYRTFDETGVPIVVVRGKDGTARAFLNVCLHRGARLVREAEGKANLFTCWFHGWSYANDGRLVGVPEAERFTDENGDSALTGSEHLIQVPVAERYGLVFVQATPGSTMDIDAHLGAFGPELELLELDKAERVKDGTLPVASNWKYALDTYGEGYHFAALHKQTLSPYFRNDITMYDRFGPHHRVLFVAKQLEAWLNIPEEDWGVDDALGGIHYIFPNTILFAGSVSPGKRYYTTFRHFRARPRGNRHPQDDLCARRGEIRRSPPRGRGRLGRHRQRRPHRGLRRLRRGLSQRQGPAARIERDLRPSGDQPAERPHGPGRGDRHAAAADRERATEPEGRRRMNGPAKIANLGQIMQLAYVPADFDGALRYWTETIGAGPFFALDHVKLDDVKYRGAPSDIDFSMALGYWGDTQIELIRQHNDAPSIYKAWLDEGREGLHHVCILVDDMAKARAVCADAGAAVAQEGLVAGGGEVIYADPGGGPGSLVEILKPGPGTHDFFAMMREAARGWDGSEPLRRLG